MPTIKLDTATTVGTKPSAKFATCEISTSKTVHGWTMKAMVGVQVEVDARLTLHAFNA